MFNILSQFFVLLGTFITEWDLGKEVCEAILCDIESVHQICLQLVSIASFYEFDGWLINIENKLNVSHYFYIHYEQNMLKVYLIPLNIPMCRAFV